MMSCTDPRFRAGSPGPAIAGFSALVLAAMAVQPLAAETVLVSVALLPTQGGNGHVLPVPAPSGDGRYVAFASRASNLVANPPHPLDTDADIFVRDLRTGSTVLVSVPAPGNAYANAGSFGPAISDDGRRVVFRSSASNLDVVRPPGNYTGVYVRDLDTGTTVMVNRSLAGGAPNGATGSTAISGDGRHVAFASSASNLVAHDPNGDIRDIFVHDLDTGTTTLITPGANLGSAGVALSGNGRFVAFESQASNLAFDPNGHRADVFVHDRQTGTTERISVALDDSAGANGSCHEALDISDDGRHVVFACLASNLVADDANGLRGDIFLRDRLAQTTVLVSRPFAGDSGADEASSNPSISGDGQRIVFDSRASNLVAHDGNGATLDVFVHDRATGTTSLVSQAADGVSGGDAPSHVPNISADGRFATFVSNAGNLVANDLNGITADAFRTALDDTVFADGFEG